jgi:hypothetical protein
MIGAYEFCPHEMFPVAVAACFYRPDGGTITHLIPQVLFLPEQAPAITAVVCVWFRDIRSCIGSFLNVAVYRLPVGKSLLHPPSHCPQCGHPIRWFDNVPVFGWLWLKGKCRACRQPISVRDPHHSGGTPNRLRWSPAAFTI